MIHVGRGDWCLHWKNGGVMAKYGIAKSAIVGLGFSELSRESIGNARKLAADAVRDAMVDASS